jgi:hypothetical protein
MKNYTIFLHLAMVNTFPFQDYFAFYCLLIFAPAVAIARRKAPLIVIPALSYIVTLLCMGGQSHWYEWYQVPLLPLFAVCFGVISSAMLRGTDIVHPLLQLVLLFPWGIQVLATPGVLVQELPLDLVKAVFIGCILGAFLLYAIARATNSRYSQPIRTAVCMTVLVVYLSASVLVVLRFDLFF